MNSTNDEELFPSLVELFKPHVAAVQWPKIVAWARGPYSMEEKKVLVLYLFLLPARLILRAVGQEGKHLQTIGSLILETIRALLHLPRLSWRHIKSNKERWLTEATAAFVRGWLSTLSYSLDAGTLDEAMLPFPLLGARDFDPTAVIRMYSGEQLSAEEIRAVLRAVKASLPAGQRLPPQAIEIIEVERRLFNG